MARSLCVEDLGALDRFTARGMGNGVIDHVRHPCHNANDFGILEKDSR